jgi:hypothetical protein
MFPQTGNGWEWIYSLPIGETVFVVSAGVIGSLIKNKMEKAGRKMPFWFYIFYLALIGIVFKIIFL